MTTYEIILFILNLLLVWGFIISFFAKGDARTKVAGFIFGAVGVCNLIYIIF